MADDATNKDGKPGFTLDLSTGKAPTRRKRKGPPPVVQQTINLSTPKPEPAPEAAAQAEAASEPKARDAGRPKGPKGGAPPRDRSKGPKPAGTSLADLLDPETLARLREGK